MSQGLRVRGQLHAGPRQLEQPRLLRVRRRRVGRRLPGQQLRHRGQLRPGVLRRQAHLLAGRQLPGADSAGTAPTDRRCASRSTGWSVAGIPASPSRRTPATRSPSRTARTRRCRRPARRLWPDLIGDPMPADPTINMWLNRAAFQSAPLGTFGNAGVGITRAPEVLERRFLAVQAAGDLRPSVPACCAARRSTSSTTRTSDRRIATSRARRSAPSPARSVTRRVIQFVRSICSRKRKKGEKGKKGKGRIEEQRGKDLQLLKVQRPSILKAFLLRFCLFALFALCRFYFDGFAAQELRSPTPNEAARRDCLARPRNLSRAVSRCRSGGRSRPAGS